MSKIKKKCCKKVEKKGKCCKSCPLFMDIKRAKKKKQKKKKKDRKKK